MEKVNNIVIKGNAIGITLLVGLIVSVIWVVSIPICTIIDLGQFFVEEATSAEDFMITDHNYTAKFFISCVSFIKETYNK